MTKANWERASWDDKKVKSNLETRVKMTERSGKKTDYRLCSLIELTFYLDFP